MNDEKIVKKKKVIILSTLIIGVILLMTGILFDLMKIDLVPNNKALIGLSFIPLSLALSSYIILVKIKKSPQQMRSIIINENDERLAALRNEAEANAFKILLGVLFLTYTGYTLMVPGDIFESVGWWILMLLLFFSFILRGALLTKAMRKHDPKQE
ncbi:MAG: hypothetical protein PHI24_14835 [Desulfitobacteriaceae bacterium]|nr:hypothetical protein [Desulfitobacteriaceae bacterium]